MDSFFLPEPINLNDVKAKDTINKNLKSFRTSHIVP